MTVSTKYKLESQNDAWIINLKNRAKDVSRIVEVPSWHLPGEAEESHDNRTRTITVLFEIPKVITPPRRLQRTVKLHFFFHIPDISKRFVSLKVYRHWPFVLQLRKALKMEMCMEHWWNGTDSVNPKYSERNLFLFPFVFHKFHTEWPQLERWPQGDGRDLMTIKNSDNTSCPITPISEKKIQIFDRGQV